VTSTDDMAHGTPHPIRAPWAISTLAALGSRPQAAV